MLAPHAAKFVDCSDNLSLVIIWVPLKASVEEDNLVGDM